MNCLKHLYYDYYRYTGKISDKHTFMKRRQGEYVLGMLICADNFWGTADKSYIFWGMSDIPYIFCLGVGVNTRCWGLAFVAD